MNHSCKIRGNRCLCTKPVISKRNEVTRNAVLVDVSFTLKKHDKKSLLLLLLLSTDCCEYVVQSSDIFNLLILSISYQMNWYW